MIYIVGIYSHCPTKMVTDKILLGFELFDRVHPYLCIEIERILNILCSRF